MTVLNNYELADKIHCEVILIKLQNKKLLDDCARYNASFEKFLDYFKNQRDKCSPKSGHICELNSLVQSMFECLSAEVKSKQGEQL